jgi:hypothetical protein
MPNGLNDVPLDVEYRRPAQRTTQRTALRATAGALVVVGLVSLVLGCRTDALLGRDNPVSGGAGGTPNPDPTGMDGSVQAGVDGSLHGDGSAVSPGCHVTQCNARIYACGDCLDNDGDGVIDEGDPECLSPCDDEEELLATGIPGQNQSACKMDCYFDNDSGSGNDQCEWDHHCDPLSVAPDYPPSGASTCEYDPAFSVGPLSCSDAELNPIDTCIETCVPLTPNGCDCFGCCEIPRNSGAFVWIGHELNGVGTCELDRLTDPTACPPCTPVRGCRNPCDACERCVGETAPPATCLTDASASDGGP